MSTAAFTTLHVAISFAGIASGIVVLVGLLTSTAFGLAGAWRTVYVITAVTSLYLNVFVLVVQSFLKAPALHALAPKGSEPAFAIRSQGMYVENV